MSAKSTLTTIATVTASSLLLAGCLASDEQSSTVQSQPVTEPAMAENQAEFQDGQEVVQELSVNTTYESPAGEEPVGFTLVVDSAGIIRETKTDVLTTSPISTMRQRSFGEALGQTVIGMNITDLTEVDRLGGSSLTTAAFNAALKDLKAQL